MFSTIGISIAGVALLIYSFVRWAKHNDGFFAKRGMPHLQPHFLLGNLGGFFLRQYRSNEFVHWLYAQYPNEKIFGAFDFRTPFYVLRDPQLIKQLAVKDFDHFENHRPFLDNDPSEVFNCSLIAMRGNRWRHMRSTLSPAFTGSKMRGMFELVHDCCADMCAELRRRTLELGSGEPLVLEMKQTFGLFANDVIASTAFGYRVNSFVDPQNAFLVNSQKLIQFRSLRRAVRFFAVRLVPRVFRALGLQVFDRDVTQFFKTIVLDTIRERREKRIHRPDMINLLMQLKRKGETAEKNIETGEHPSTPEWTDNEIVGQCFLFFFAGFQTVSTALAFLVYELACNPEVQRRLQAECDAVRRELSEAGQGDGTRVPYERLLRMPYLEQVVCEALRLWPPSLFVDRECSRAYAYDDGRLSFQVDAGQYVWIPIGALHRDAKYWPEPLRFRPERFSDENRQTIEAGAYLPFGVGPRNCIASRFALMEVKAAVYQLMLEFSVRPTTRTQIPLLLTKGPGPVTSERGIHLELEARY